MTDISELASDEAERMILGGVLVDNLTMSDAIRLLQSSHFANVRHRALWDATVALWEKSEPIDLVTLKNQLGPELVTAGGVGYLAGLIDGVPRISHMSDWCRIVLDWAKKRGLIWLSERAISEVHAGVLGTPEILEKYHSAILQLMQVTGGGGVVTLKDSFPGGMKLIDEFVQSEDGVVGIPCGLPEVDRKIGGWKDGCLYIIAARPGRGKSVFSTQSAVHAALRGRKVLTFNLEMPPEDVAIRMLCGHAGLDKWDLKGVNSTAAWTKLNASLATLSDVPIWFDRRETVSIAQIRATTRQHQARKGCDLLIVDYIQRCQKPANLDGWVATGAIVEGLKNLALGLQIPVIAACQVNADGEERRPHMGMLAEARGKISAEADVIAFLHPKEPLAWKQQDKPEMTFIIDKNRGGQTCDIALTFDKACNRFIERYTAFGDQIETWARQLPEGDR